MAATSTLVSALPATDNFAHDPTASASSANHSGQASGTRSRRGGAARGGGNRSRGRGNGRFQNAREFTDQPPPGGATLPQPGDGAYLANVSNRPPSGNQSRRPNQPRMPQGPNDPRQRARNAHQQQAPENQPVLPVDHSRSGLAGNADGAVAGSIIQGQIHGDADRVTIGVSSGRGDRPPKTRNRNNRNNKANTSQNTAEGSNRPSIPNNEENTGSKPQPRKNGRERQQQSQQGVSKPPVNARRAAFGGKLSSYAANGKSKNHDGDAENQFEEAQDRAMLGYSSVDRRNVFGMSKEADDLTSRLIRGLTSRPFLECPICFSDLLPSQAIWSCLPTFSSTNPSTADTTCCYTPFHLSCMQDWSSRSLKEARELPLRFPIRAVRAVRENAATATILVLYPVTLDLVRPATSH
ncbi:hypothetical protein QFC19_006685 [Naganishia cerealis]|uniref:Uncharacterized protein n=1 Tax=Naganishia cerealis TaxID=610337 RepID=A0ACC2VGX4_9TREE|nr:hypothetical protein QFC19_006685 [Naganishia cerealis]